MTSTGLVRDAPWLGASMVLLRPRPLARYASTAVDNKAFSKTLLLPKTTFPQWTDPNKTEKALREKTCDGLYRWQVALIAISVYWFERLMRMA